MLYEGNAASFETLRIEPLDTHSQVFELEAFVVDDADAKRVKLVLPVRSCEWGEVEDDKKKGCAACGEKSYSFNKRSKICHECPASAVCHVHTC